MSTSDPFTEIVRVNRQLGRIERQRVLATQSLNARYDAKRQALINALSKPALRVWLAAAEENEAADGGEDIDEDPSEVFDELVREKFPEDFAPKPQPPPIDLPSVANLPASLLKEPEPLPPGAIRELDVSERKTGRARR